MTVAAQGSLRPSAVLGIGCETCAYFVDESLVIRDWDAMRAAGQAMESNQQAQFHHNNARALMGRDLHG
jgi:hypothetical protein